MKRRGEGREAEGGRRGRGGRGAEGGREGSEEGGKKTSQLYVSALAVL